MKDPIVLSIQDVSCFGQCSLTVALPIISAMGVETAILPSAVLSTYTGGFKGYTFRDLTEDIPKIREHWAKEGIAFDAIYTGYVGNKKQLSYIKDMVSELKKPNGLFIVDPVMGDGGKFYPGFGEEFCREMRRFIKGADVILPNLSEAAFLLGESYKEGETTPEEAERTVRALSELSGGSVCLTGVAFDNARLGAAVYNKAKDKVTYCFDERIQGAFHGTGDIFASTFTGAVMNSRPIEEAAAVAVGFTVRAIKETLGDLKEHWYGVRFEKALPYLIREMGK